MWNNMGQTMISFEKVIHAEEHDWGGGDVNATLAYSVTANKNGSNAAILKLGFGPGV